MSSRLFKGIGADYNHWQFQYTHIPSTYTSNCLHEFQLTWPLLRTCQASVMSMNKVFTKSKRGGEMQELDIRRTVFG